MAAERERTATRRITAFDTLRGFTIVSMIAFHACYDLAYIAGMSLPWFTGTLFQDVWRASISWTFLLIAGWMTSLSRNNLRRAGVYAIAALVVYAATALAGVDTAVSFGIIFCMAASTALYALLERARVRLHPAIGFTVALVLFALTYDVPRTRYDIEGLAWLGLPSPSFSSGDYYPLLPYGFLYAAGAFAAQWFKRAAQGAYPSWMYRDWCPPLTVLGRASLFIYLVHQPLLLLLMQLVTGS